MNAPQAIGPLDQAPRSVPPSLSIPGTQHSSSRAGEAVRLLVIDDNPQMLDIYRRILTDVEDDSAVVELDRLEASLTGMPVRSAPEHPSFHVDLVSDGQHGCTLARIAHDHGQPYGVAFVDMRMPGGWDGLQTVERLWQTDHAIEVVICTAFADHTWHDIALRLGRTDRLLFLRKPFERLEVLQLASALSDKWRLQRERQAQVLELQRARDELERRVAERTRELSRRNRLYAALSEINKAIVHAADSEQLFRAVCRIAVEHGGMRLACVALVDEAAQELVPASHCGLSAAAAPRDLRVSLRTDSAVANCQLTAVVREARSYICHDLADAALPPAWHAQLQANGLRAAALFPLFEDERVKAVLSLHAAPAGFFDEELVAFLTEMVADVSFALDNLRRDQQLQYQATHDALTGLPNQNLLRDRLAQALACAQRERRSVALAVLDLDQFKLVNDSLGHTAGDQLLKVVAERLCPCIRRSDTLARMGGDEFVLVLPDWGGAPRPPEPAEHAAAHAQQDDEVGVVELLQRLQAALTAPIAVAGRELQITCSIGLAMYPQDASDAELLLQHADAAMYEAKTRGRAGFHFYSSELNRRIARRLALEAGLRRAVERNELALHYQPKLGLRSGRVIGAEALLRWTSCEDGPISPAEFIPLAEESGLIEPIGAWVLQTACAQLARWQAGGMSDISLAVNLSPRQLRSTTLVETVHTLLAEHRIDPGRLELEITETALMIDLDRSRAVLRDLKALGVRLALDDFGTGYSSLAYLKHFRADTLKIDRSFVRDLAVDPSVEAMTAAIIALAASLGLRTVAEGVETQGQLRRLRALGCDEMQGFLFSAAVSAEAFGELLAAGRGLAIDGGVENPPC